jgi:hypothetical protein
MVGADTSHEVLLRIGIRVESGSFLVSNTHSGIAAIMSGTRWASGWTRALRRLPGATACENMKFASSQSRSTRIRLDPVFP